MLLIWALATLFFLSLKYPKHIQTPGPLHVLFPLPETLFYRQHDQVPHFLYVSLPWTSYIKSHHFLATIHQYQLGPTIWFWHYLELGQTQQVKGSVLQNCPHIRCQLYMGSLSYLHFCPVNYEFGSSHETFPRQEGSMICWNDWQNLGKHYIYDYSFIIKDRRNTQMGEMYRKRYGGRQMVPELPSFSRYATSSDRDVLTNQVAPWTLCWKKFITWKC